MTFLPDGTSEIEANSLGTFNNRNETRHWRIGGTVWLRDTGQATKVLNGIWQAYDDIYNTLSKDDSLNGSAKASQVTAISNQFGQFMNQGGQLWKPVNFVVIADEF